MPGSELQLAEYVMSSHGESNTRIFHAVEEREQVSSLLLSVHLIQGVANDKYPGKPFRSREEHADEIARRGILGSLSQINLFYVFREHCRRNL